MLYFVLESVANILRKGLKCYK
uniref:Uncharacterized protein n=1 Tax=Arundo donax TaxID=35708 RepID=A0A0A9AT97_ARUDO